MKPIVRTLLATAAASVLSSCDDAPSGDEPVAEDRAAEALKLSAEALENAALSYADASPSEVAELARAFGEITPNTEKIASVSARVDGVIAEGRVDLGEQVSAGQVLAVLESQSLASDIVTYLQTERDQRFARAELAREKGLFDKKLASSESYYGKEQAFQKAQIAHAAALQPLELLHFQEGILHSYLENPDAADLTHFEVRAPLAGVVTRKQLTKGEYVAAEDELFVVADLAEVWVDFQVPLGDADYITPDTKVSVVANNIADSSAQAAVRYVAPMANKANRTVDARATLPNPDGAWRPGTPVTVTFPRGGETFPVTVPSSALLDFEGGFVVFVKVADKEFELREVEPGARGEGRVAIKAGLTAGETVVTDGAYQLKAQWGMGGDE